MSIIFFTFSIFLVISSFMVIISRNSVFSLLFLVASLLFSACLLFLLECEFLALIFIIVYVGAIEILFLFSIKKFKDLSENIIKYLPIGVFFGIGFLSVLLYYEVNSNFETNPYEYFSFRIYSHNWKDWVDLIDSLTDVEVYGVVLYSYFVLQLLVIGLILLVVLIGVVYLTNVYSIDEHTLEQSSFKQLARESKFFIAYNKN